MKTIRSSLPWAVLALVVWLAGCASPDSRIRANAAIFDGLPPHQQQLIREGRVAIGFTPEMVYLAVGEPDRRWARTDADGRSEVWTYTTYESESGAHLYRGWFHRYYGAPDPLYPYYLDHGSRKAREYFKVTFREGAVVLIEEDQRR
jgi:hypothetical protein